MDIEVAGPDRSVTAFPDGTPTSAMQAALARAYGGPQPAGAALAQLSEPDAPGAPSASAAPAAPAASLAALPAGGGYGPIADAAGAAAGPALDALASDPAPVWSGRLALLGHARAVRDAAGEMAGSLLDAGVSPAMAGLSLDPDTGEWGLPKRLDDVTGAPPTAATWLGLYNTLPSLMQTDPWTGAVLPDSDSPLNANIARIAGHLSSAFVGDPLTGEGGAMPGYGQVLNQFGDHFSIRAAHDGMNGALFSSDPSGFDSAWASAQTPAEQAAARTAIAGDIADRLQTGRILPGQLGAPDAQSRLATAFGADGAQAIAAQAEDSLASRYGSPAGDAAPPSPTVTAPPTAALAIGAQPPTPITPIAASLVQGFDPGGIASSLRPAGVARSNSNGLGQHLSVPTSLRGPLFTTPQGQSPSGERYAEGGDSGRLLDADGNPEIVVYGRRRAPIRAPTPPPSQPSPGGFWGAIGGFGRALDEFVNPDSNGFYRRLRHSEPLTPAQLAPVWKAEAAQQAREHAYSTSPDGLVLGAPVAAGAALLGVGAAELAPFVARGAQALGTAALRFALNHPRAVAGASLATRLAHGALTGADPTGEPPALGEAPEPLDDANPGRPSWRQSELDVGHDLGPGHTGQQSYLGGVPVRTGTPGSVRPDWVADDGSASYEVQNYNLQTNTRGLINKISRQAIMRAQHLPKGMTQRFIIDARGQTVTPELERAINQQITEKTKGMINPRAISISVKQR